MAWNQPGNNGQDNDPWGNKNKGKSNGSPADFLNKLNELFKKRSSGGNNGSQNSKLPFGLPAIIGALVVVIVAIWAISGFYTINQSERGVITRFGQVQPQVVLPGLNWYPPLIDKVYTVDTQGTRNFNVQGFMITAGENLVFVEMNVQFRVENPIKYLFNVTNVEDSLRQAADSALRLEIGSSNMDAILTDGRSVLETRTKEELINIISNYDMGINIVDLNFQSIRPPAQVQDAFNDAIKAREDREREINKAEADKVQLVQQAEGRSARILANANAYKVRIELEAQGDVAQFEMLLPEYKAAPEITKERLYIQTMEQILSRTAKIIVNEQNGNLLVLPLDQLLKNKEATVDTNEKNTTPKNANGYDMNLLNSSTSPSGNLFSTDGGNSSQTINSNSSNLNSVRTSGR